MSEEFVCVLLKHDLIKDDQVSELGKLAKESGRHFFRLLVEKHEMLIEQLKPILATHYNIDFVALQERQIPHHFMAKFHYDFLFRHEVLPLEIVADEVLVAMANPFDIAAVDAMEHILDCDVKPVFAKAQEIKMAIHEYSSESRLDDIRSQFAEKEETDWLDKTETEREDVQNAPAVRLVNSILDSAILNDATDIHIEPYENRFRIRFRIDGQLCTQKEMESDILPSVISRIKIISGMDIAEKRLPQDGHFRQNRSGEKIDYRVNTIPTVFGEKMAIRVTCDSKALIDKGSLGFFEEDLQKIDYMLQNPHGAILVTGPTSSGKNTTLISFLSELNRDNVNIITVEDPVEKVISGTNQIEVNQKIDLKFTEVLHAVLRQDPDIVMIGEIRDAETAQIAIRAALTGHLVLSTLHTNDAIATITRLIDMGVEAHMIPEALKGIISQRLVRKICKECKEEYTIAEEERLALRLDEGIKTFRGAGCAYCRETGYKGRFAVYEILSMQEHRSKHLLKTTKSGSKKLNLSHLRKGMVTIRENLLRNVNLGNTTIEEMRRIVFGSDY